MKVDQLEAKITTELSMLKERIDKMSAELVMYDDLENLRVAGEKKKKVRRDQYSLQCDS